MWPSFYSIVYMVLVNMGLLLALRNMLQHNYKQFLSLFLGYQLTLILVPYLIVFINARMVVTGGSQTASQYDHVNPTMTTTTYQSVEVEEVLEERKTQGLGWDIKNLSKSRREFKLQLSTRVVEMKNGKKKPDHQSRTIQHPVLNIGQSSTKREQDNGEHGVGNPSRKQALYYTGSLNTSDPLTAVIPFPFLQNYTNPCFYDNLGNLRCLPYFFFLTPQKCGSSDLWELLSRHPCIVKPTRKEPHWFDRRRFGVYSAYNKHKLLVHYMQFFSSVHEQYWKSQKSVQHSAAKKKAIINQGKGELYNPLITFDSSASTLYDQLLWRMIPENKGRDQPVVISAHFIKHLIPKAKFVVMLRDPVTRLYSDWLYFVKRLNSSASPEIFHEAVITGINLWNNCVQSKGNTFRQCLYDLPPGVENVNRWHPDLDWSPLVRLRIGMYYYFLKDWLGVFPRSQFYILSLKQYSANRSSVAKELFKFLGLDPVHITTDWFPRNKRNLHSPLMLLKTSRLLEMFYKPFNEKLAHLMNDPIYLWKGH